MASGNFGNLIVFDWIGIENFHPRYCGSSDIF
jgi:hypothetical protein